MGLIGMKVEKKNYNFFFPTIENEVRKIEPIETLFADVASLDLVSCYMQKNMNSVQSHSQSRQ